MKSLPDVIDILYDCATACEHCATSCLHEPNVAMMAACIMNDRDCADVCRLTAALLARNSSRATSVVRACIDMCDACAAECEKHEEEHCRLCAEACRKCAEACRGILSW